MATRTPSSLGEVINIAIDRSMRNLNVSIPGTVLEYDEDTQLATVKPGVARMLPSEQDDDELYSEDLPEIFEVPVCWPQGRGFRLVGTLEQGDPILLVFLDRDPSGWLTTGGDISEPDDNRVHHASFAVGIPGLVPENNPMPEPTDSAALASRLDALIGLMVSIWGTTIPPTSGAGAGAINAFMTALKIAFPNLPAHTGLVTALETTGTEFLKLDTDG